jgi:hypothetical protein
MAGYTSKLVSWSSCLSFGTFTLRDVGQAIGNNAALLPPAMQERFSKLFDDAPQVSYSVIEKVFLR